MRHGEAFGGFEAAAEHPVEAGMREPERTAGSEYRVAEHEAGNGEDRAERVEVDEVVGERADLRTEEIGCDAQIRGEQDRDQGPEWHVRPGQREAIRG
jgi:hypothetical protein